MKSLLYRTALARKLTAAEVDGNFSDVKAAVDATEQAAMALATKVQGVVALVGSGSADTDTVINAVAEVYAYLQGVPEGTGALLAKLNSLQQQITNLAVNGGGGAGGSPNTAGLGLDVNELYLTNLIEYDTDGVTVISEKLDLKINEIVNYVRQAIVGTPTPNSQGESQNNVAAPMGNTVVFLRKQTFIPPAPFVVGDMELAYGADLATTFAYAGPADLGNSARGLGYLQARVKAAAGRNPSAWTKSLALAAGPTQDYPAQNYYANSADFGSHSNYGSGSYDVLNVLAPDGSMTAVQARSYGSGTINLQRAEGLVNGNVYHTSILLKPDDISVITGAEIRTNDNENVATFDFKTLVALGSTAPMRSAIIQDLSSLGDAWKDWFYFGCSFQLQGNAIDLKVRTYGGYGGLCIWAPQINDGLLRTQTLLTSIPT